MLNKGLSLILAVSILGTGYLLHPLLAYTIALIDATLILRAEYIWIFAAPLFVGLLYDLSLKKSIPRVVRRETILYLCLFHLLLNYELIKALYFFSSGTAKEFLLVSFTLLVWFVVGGLLMYASLSYFGYKK